ncbi:MAG TPA: SMC family ATPase, partial [Stackebrandtia sp.]|uniref:SMC family ATPase n=1 Tax=Stackebrandtia sp. TaxID=2023065 RepID=UPI002D6EDBDA
MRPLRLDMEGFGTFSRSTTIDFCDADFFALVGPTGSGKSTVLDAICFALYGRAPRWGTGIEYALAPSATSGKVRLVFSAAETRYVATRVVKRGSRGKVTTTSAALEKLPPGTTDADLDRVSDLIGTPLSSSAKGLSEHVERIIGLPFDQFTKCVLLPQGAFAEFLHSSAADRRKILENLLGCAVYRDIQTVAGEEHRAAEAVLSHLDRQLSGLGTVTDEAITAAEQRVEASEAVAADVRGQVPRLDTLNREAAAASEALKAVDAETALLTYIRRPDNVDSIAEDVAASAAAVAEARGEVSRAEEAEERLRSRLADVDLARVDRLLAEHAKAADIADKVAKGTPLTEAAEAAHTAAKEHQSRAVAAVAEAENALDAAKTADLAAT